MRQLPATIRQYSIGPQAGLYNIYMPYMGNVNRHYCDECCTGLWV